VSISVELDDRVADVRVTDEALEVRLRDGRRISAPLAWFPRLVAANATQRANWEPAAAGHGVHWPDIDEDLSIAGLLRTTAAS
jgi:hypothetical protein